MNNYKMDNSLSYLFRVLSYHDTCASQSTDEFTFQAVKNNRIWHPMIEPQIHIWGCKQIRNHDIVIHSYTVPWSFLAVKRTVPVSSPMRHSAMRDCRAGFRDPDPDPPFWTTSFASRTFTVSVWPYVPGFRLSTLTNTGFLSPGFAAALGCASVAIGWVGTLKSDGDGVKCVALFLSLWN